MILSNGTGTPLTAPIQRNGSLYTLTGDIHAELVVQKSNIGDDSSRNNFYQNNILDNNASVGGFSWRENWNSTYLVGGNYWSDYSGTDNIEDGIGDTEYIIDENNKDYYPLMAPVEVPIFEVPHALPEYVPPIPEEPEERETPDETPDEIPEEPPDETPDEPNEKPDIPDTEEPTNEQTQITNELVIPLSVILTEILSVAAFLVIRRRK